MLLTLAAYCIGSIPFGLITGRLKGIDLRQHGSRNIGATNAGRVLGRKFFWIVFFLDMLKSFTPMLIASLLIARHPVETLTWVTYTLWIGIGLSAMLGHIFPPWLGFRGGKGVACSAGVVLGLWPYFTLAGCVAIAVFIVVAFVWRYISLASIIGTSSFPVAFALIGKSRGWDVFGAQLPLFLISILLVVLIISRHRENIGRLRNGTENKIGARKPVTT
jgi:acyl phosphate:glycerol-3-phosphate acyltransferase